MNRRGVWLLIFMTGLVLASSSSSSSTAQDNPNANADLVVRGGKVITVDDAGTITEALAVRGNRILAVGTDAEIEAFIGAHTLVIELEGRVLLPGFIDAHNHLEGSAHGDQFRLPVSIPR